MTQTNLQGDLMTIADIAERIGVDVMSMRTYHQRAAINRRASAVRKGDLPEPTRRFGRSPVWEAETIEQWITERPGRGRTALPN